MNTAGSTTSQAIRCLLRCLALIFSIWASAVQAANTIHCPLADGFDFPVGKPEAASYYKSRGFYPNGHLGEDWNGRGGGDSDLGDPIYAIAGGVVVHSDNVGVGWGNVIIVRHAFRAASGKIEMIDSLYGHLLARHVKLHQLVVRGQQIGTMGSNNGMYPAHLHFEIRKNLKIGMNRSQFARDYSNYYSPTQFINAHRRLSSSMRKFEMPVNTFAPYGKSLDDIDRSFSSKGLSIPVFPTPASGNMPGIILTPKGGKSASAGSTVTAPGQKSRTGINPSGLATKPASLPPPPAGEPDFWSRLKSKLKDGKLIDKGHDRTSR